MNYGFNSSLYGKVFAVPGVLVEKHLRLAGAAQLKALLWLLYHSGESCDDEELSRVLGLSRGDVCDAMQYWIDNGLVFACEDRADVFSAKEGIQETKCQKDPHQSRGNKICYERSRIGLAFIGGSGAVCTSAFILRNGKFSGAAYKRRFAVRRYTHDNRICLSE